MGTHTVGASRLFSQLPRRSLKGVYWTHLSPNSNFLRITTEGFDVFLDPFKGKSLITKTEVCVTGVLISDISNISKNNKLCLLINLLKIAGGGRGRYHDVSTKQKAKATSSVVYRHPNYRLPNLNALLDDVAHIISISP